MLGFKSTKSNRPVFVSIIPQHSTFILVYVDILVKESNYIEVQKLISKLYEHFSLKDLV